MGRLLEYKLRILFCLGFFFTLDNEILNINDKWKIMLLVVNDV